MIESKRRHLIDEVPPNIVQGNVAYNVVKAIGNQEAKLFAEIDKSIIQDNLEIQSDEVIWHLLWENHLIKPSEGLILASDKSERIELIKAAVDLHRYKGTPYAIERSLEVVGLEGRNEEWYEYDGEPYHFWIELSLKRKLGELELIRMLVMEYKNKRSWFEGFVILALEQGFLYWDDSYSYPVYYKACNDFWGTAKTVNTEVGGTVYIDDSYSYPVYFETNTIQFKNIDTGVGLVIADGSYSYPVYHKVCGELETMHMKNAQFDGNFEMTFEAYSYPTYYQVCGEFEAGG